MNPTDFNDQNPAQQFGASQNGAATPQNDDSLPGWDAITARCLEFYPGQNGPMHYGTMIKWDMGGPDPLDGISIYDGGDYWHFVTYGLSELGRKRSSNPDVSGYGLEFTFRLKKSCCVDKDKEIANVCVILQALARMTFVQGEVYKPFEYIYTQQTQGIDDAHVSLITGFITAPDSKFQSIDTPNGKVQFVELIGATDAELLAIIHKQITTRDLYARLGEVTDYARQSVM